MKSFLLLCLLSLVACANVFAADKNEKPLSVTFLSGYNGSPRIASYVSGETIHMKVVAKNVTVPKSGKCLLSMRYYIVDKDDKVVYSHQQNDASARVTLGYSDAKFLASCPINSIIDPGEYQFVTEMRDKESRETYRSRQSILLLPKDDFVFALLCFTSALDKEEELGPSFEIGQPVLLHWKLQSPQADEEGYWRIESTVRIFNKAKQNIRRDRQSVTSEVSATSRGIFSASAEIKITIPGEYMAEVEAKDLVSGKVLKSLSRSESSIRLQVFHVLPHFDRFFVQES